MALSFISAHSYRSRSPLLLSAMYFLQNNGQIQQFISKQIAIGRHVTTNCIILRNLHWFRR